MWKDSVIASRMEEWRTFGRTSFIYGFIWPFCLWQWLCVRIVYYKMVELECWHWRHDLSVYVGCEALATRWRSLYHWESPLYLRKTNASVKISLPLPRPSQCVGGTRKNQGNSISTFLLHIQLFLFQNNHKRDHCNFYIRIQFISFAWITSISLCGTLETTTCHCVYTDGKGWVL